MQTIMIVEDDPDIRDGVRIALDCNRVWVDEQEADLTETEYKILKLLMQHPGEVLSPKEIYRRVWKGDPLGGEGTVAVHIRHLREKIEIDPADPRYIKVVWGQGYMLAKDRQEA